MKSMPKSELCLNDILEANETFHWYQEKTDKYLLHFKKGWKKQYKKAVESQKRSRMMDENIESI